MMIRFALVVLALIAASGAQPASAQEDQSWVKRTLRIERLRQWREERRERQLMAAREAERRELARREDERRELSREEIERREFARRDAERRREASLRRDGTRVYGYIRREADVRGRSECLAARSVVGLERYSLEEAKENAISLWMEAEKLHNGVKYMNPNNAIVISADGKGPECYLSSTGNRTSEQLAEKANKVAAPVRVPRPALPRRRRGPRRPALNCTASGATRARCRLQADTAPLQPRHPRPDLRRRTRGVHHAVVRRAHHWDRGWGGGWRGR